MLRPPKSVETQCGLVETHLHLFETHFESVETHSGCVKTPFYGLCTTGGDNWISCEHSCLIVRGEFMDLLKANCHDNRTPENQVVRIDKLRVVS